MGSPNFQLPVSELYDVLPNFSQYDNFIALRENVIKWGSYWGGVNAWPDTLDYLFHCAKNHGTPERFIEKVWTHELCGHELLHALQVIIGILPQGAVAVCMIWAYQQEQVIMVTQGISIIWTKLPLFREEIGFREDAKRALGQSKENMLMNNLVWDPEYFISKDMESLPPSDIPDDEDDTECSTSHSEQSGKKANIYFIYTTIPLITQLKETFGVLNTLCTHVN